MKIAAECGIPSPQNYAAFGKHPFHSLSDLWRRSQNLHGAVQKELPHSSRAHKAFKAAQCRFAPAGPLRNNRAHFNSNGTAIQGIEWENIRYLFREGHRQVFAVLLIFKLGV